MRSVPLNTECEAAQGDGWRHGLILRLRGMVLWEEEEAWIPSPSGMAKYLPSTTWLSRHIHSAPSPSLLCSAQKRRKLAWSARQGAKPMTKSFSSLPEVTEVQLHGKTGLCIFKTSGPTFGESRAHQARHRWKKKKPCQMIFVLPNDLEKGTLRTQRVISADFSELVFHIHYLFFPPSHGRILIAYNSD